MRSDEPIGDGSVIGANSVIEKIVAETIVVGSLQSRFSTSTIYPIVGTVYE
jgi:serine acetyltransferase